jgi:choloylglycine hydrolase
MNGLYLAESDYGPADDRPTMSILAFGQYVLDMFATVAEAVAELQDDSTRLIAPPLPNGKATTVHMAISDPTGDSGIFEFIDGKLTVHHGAQYQVMTNSPSYDQQLAIEAYWGHIDPLAFLPGSFNAADRFARVSYMIGAIPREIDARTISAVPSGTFENQAAASVLSVMRAVSVPLGITHPTKPNLSSSLWRTVHDHQSLVTFFDSATTPNTFWIPLAELDFSEGAPVKKLEIAGGQVYAGNAVTHFVDAEPFPFSTTS